MTDDRNLVRLAREGDRTAFEEIVHRYQTLVCSITYSGTGDLAISEDLAQETFVTAWQSLAKLREPENLRSWLCGIARRLAANRRRSSRRIPPATPLDADSVASVEADPPAVAIREEQHVLVWQALSQLPDKYREPLVLFYREGQNVRQVADGLDLSEAAVKQRLSRGRRLLSDRLAALVETTLEQSKPGEFFSAGVIAALPALGPQVAAGTVVTAGGKGSAAKAALVGGTGAAFLGPVLGILAALFSVRIGVRQARSSRERRLMIFAGCFLFGYIALLNLFIAAAYFLLGTTSLMTAIAVLSLLSILHVVGIVCFAIWLNRRQRQIRTETNTALPPGAEVANMTSGRIAGALGGSVFGSVFWILLMSLASGDLLSAAWVSGISLITFVAGYATVHRSRSAFYRVSFAMTSVLGVLNLLVVNLRWPGWVRRFTEGTSDPLSILPPLWALNLLLIAIFAMVLTAILYKSRASSLAADRSDGVGDAAAARRTG